MCTNSLPSGRSQRAMRCSSCVVVAHVLEHLDRDAAVEGVRVAAAAWFTSRVSTLTLRRPRARHCALDVLALAGGVGDRGDAAPADSARPSTASASPSRSRARGCRWPSASWARSPYSASIASSACVQRLVAGRVVAAAVLQARAEAAAGRSRSAVRSAGRLAASVVRSRPGCGAVLQRAAKRATAPAGRRRAFFAQALRAQAADAEAQQRVGHQAAFGQADQARRVVRSADSRSLAAFMVKILAGCGDRQGNHGNSIGVVRW